MTPPRSFSAGPLTPPTAARRPLLPAERLRQLEELRAAVHADFARLGAAMADGRIGVEEYRYYLRETYGGRDEPALLRDIAAEERSIDAAIARERRETKEGMPLAAAFTFTLLIGALFAVLLLTNGESPTGFVAFDTERSMDVDFLFVGGGVEPLNLSNVTALTVTGDATAAARIYLLVDGERRLVFDGGPAGPFVTTDKESYALNGTVNVTVTPAEASYTLWLTDAAGGKLLVADGFTVTEPGAFTLDALINDTGNVTKASVAFTVRNDTNASDDVPRLAPVTLSFTDACAETCVMEPTGGATLALEAVTDGEVRVATVTATAPRENGAPQLLLPIPALALTVGEPLTLDLAAHFADPDGDALTFDFMDVPGVEMSVDGTTLRILATAPGERQSILYASDLHEIAQSNIFTLTVTGEAVPPLDGNGTNGTTPDANATPVNTTLNLSVNATLNVTGNLTVNGTNVSVDCSDPDPNMRPVECLQLESAKYFPDNELFLTTTGRTPIARITPIGNLLISGDVQELALFTPDLKDYVIGYEDEYGVFRVTVWFDSGSGDLYLRGRLFEENENNVPPPGAYALRNKKGITLAWADQASGDLYLRGNLIPYRRSITE